jgi:hypothetical protein
MMDIHTMWLDLKAFVRSRQKQILLFAGVAVIFFSAVFFWFLPKNFSPVPTSDDVSEPWKTYESAALGFRVSHPADWYVEETDAPTGPDILILKGAGSGFDGDRAFVRVRGFLDQHVDSPESIQSSIARYEEILAAQTNVIITEFQQWEIENDIAGFQTTGEFVLNGRAYSFEERGWLSMAGQVLILRAADAPENFEASLPVMRQIMDSFTIE